MYDFKFFALHVTDSSTEIEKCNIPVYYKQMLFAIQELNRLALVKNRNEIIWCNDNIRFNKRVLEYRHWSKSGLLRVDDLILNDTIDRELIRGKLKNKAAFYFEWSRLIKNVPVDMITNCSFNNVHDLIFQIQSGVCYQ